MNAQEEKVLGIIMGSFVHILQWAQVFFVFKYSCSVQYIFYSREKVSLSLNFHAWNGRVLINYQKNRAGKKKKKMLYPPQNHV